MTTVNTLLKSTLPFGTVFHDSRWWLSSNTLLSVAIRCSSFLNPIWQTLHLKILNTENTWKPFFSLQWKAAACSLLYPLHKCRAVVCVWVMWTVEKAAVSPDADRECGTGVCPQGADPGRSGGRLTSTLKKKVYLLHSCRLESTVNITGACQTGTNSECQPLGALSAPRTGLMARTGGKCQTAGSPENNWK